MSPEYKHICKALSFRGKRLQRVGKVFFTIFAKKQIRTTRGRPHTSECQRDCHETCALWVLSRAGKVPRPPAGGRNLSQGTDFLRKAGESPALLFVLLRVSPLRRRPKGFPVALWKPSGFHPLRGMGATKNGFFVEGRGKPRFAFLVLHRVSLLQGNYDQTVNNRQEINKTAKFVDFSASPRDQSIARGWQKFL